MQEAFSPPPPTRSSFDFTSAAPGPPPERQQGESQPSLRSMGPFLSLFTCFRSAPLAKHYFRLANGYTPTLPRCYPQSTSSRADYTTSTMTPSSTALYTYGMLTSCLNNLSNHVMAMGNMLKKLRKAQVHQKGGHAVRVGHKLWLKTEWSDNLAEKAPRDDNALQGRHSALLDNTNPS